MNLKMIQRIVLFVTLVTAIQCQNKKIPNPVDLSKAILKIDSCGLYYNQHRLNLGDDFKDWEKVLGKPSRKFPAYIDEWGGGVYVWDDLGISVDNYQNGGGTIAWVRFHFLNLDSPEGKAGNLNHARSFESAAHIVERNIVDGVSLISEEREKEIERENKEAIKTYKYPFKVYQGYVNLHGFPVASGMDVAAINAYRGDLYFSGKFGYVDQDIDGVNDSGNTTDTFGGDYKASGKECKNGRLQYYRLTYTPTGALEYLKIGHEGERNYQSRQRVKARRKKEKEALLNQGEKNE